MGRRWPRAGRDLVNRADRRRVGGSGTRAPHESYVFSIADALFENAKNPHPELTGVLDTLLERYGLGIDVRICRDCRDIEVYL
jgi:hypothetical protein